MNIQIFKLSVGFFSILLFFGCSSNKCITTEVKSSVLDYRFGNKQLEVKYIDLDSLSKVDLHNRTSPLNAYFFSISKFEVAQLEAINLMGNLVKAGIALPDIQGAIVFSSTPKNAHFVDFESTPGALIYHVDSDNQLVASLFRKTDLELKLISGLQGFVDEVYFSHVEKASRLLPFIDDSYKSALFLLKTKDYQTKKANKDDFESKISKYFEQYRGSTGVSAP